LGRKDACKCQEAKKCEAREEVLGDAELSKGKCKRAVAVKYLEYTANVAESRPSKIKRESPEKRTSGVSGITRRLLLK